jgi:hypothetical protein
MKLSTIKQIAKQSSIGSAIHYTIRGNIVRVWFTEGHIAIKKIMNTLDFCKEFLGHVETTGTGKLCITEKGMGERITKSEMEKVCRAERTLFASYNRELLIKLLQSMGGDIVSIYAPANPRRESIQLKSKNTHAVLMPMMKDYRGN